MKIWRDVLGGAASWGTFVSAAAVVCIDDEVSQEGRMSTGEEGSWGLGSWFLEKASRELSSWVLDEEALSRESSSLVVDGEDQE